MIAVSMAGESHRCPRCGYTTSTDSWGYDEYDECYYVPTTATVVSFTESVKESDEQEGPDPFVWPDQRPRLLSKKRPQPVLVKNVMRHRRMLNSNPRDHRSWETR